MELLLLLALPFLVGSLAGSDDESADPPDDEALPEAADALSFEGRTALLAEIIPQQDPTDPEEQPTEADPWWTGLDRLEGSDSDDTLAGDEGNDLIYGGEGNDLIELGEGDNLYWSYPEREPEVYETYSQGDDTVIGGSGFDVIHDIHGFNSLEGGAGYDNLLALDNLMFVSDTAPGRFQFDLDAIATPDQLFGGAGNDHLNGDMGDTMTGGEGEDLFWAYIYQDGADPVTITDYSSSDGLIIQVAHDIIPEEMTQDGQPADFTTDPDTGDVTISHSGIDLVILKAPVDFSPNQISISTFFT